MKIIHLITAFGIGGAEKLLLNIVNLQSENHEVHLIYLKPIDDLITQVDKRVNVIYLPLSISIRKKLLTTYKTIAPDIIHTHLVQADFLGLWSTKKTKAKIFCTLHNVSIKQNALDKIIFYGYKKLFKRVLEKLQIIAISKTVKNHAIHTLKVPEKRVNLLYNAIPPLAKLDDKIEIEIPLNKLILLYVGRLEKQKSVETLLNAINQLKRIGYGTQIELFIIGDGKLKSSLMNLTKKLDIDEMVNFLDKTTRVEHYLMKADLFILPSIWEGFGIVILEAFRAALPVIASNIEGPSELIIDNVNGLLFKPRNHVELSEKIVELLHDEQKRKALGEKGYDTFTNRFHINEYVESLNNLYERELND